LTPSSPESSDLGTFDQVMTVILGERERDANKRGKFCCREKERTKLEEINVFDMDLFLPLDCVFATCSSVLKWERMGGF